ncbi:Nif3-like dinuclear metal center hexameric protein [Inconstantimicrobium mannanitabidum]|uniref:GTP cyclohydrolase 1 type 2 n=1 Tax=Inconstantimicrobium mannanitabidum TaxID=1604901 RepID=A0ACB5R991_9CLOT|nr:Nif3-like dinuclear metal center hexameric protein [Clostridium sp. TW13]GKX65593.1 GTP cyclohydrolase 1 type 2 [Clostridium sp. TW13]
MKLKDFIEIMESIAPKELKESYDNVGLMIGDSQKEITKILLALDCTLDVIEEAVENKVELIVTHHPLLFIKPSNITTDTLQGRKVINLIQNDIALYSSHTNFDTVCGGLNDSLLRILGFEKGDIIEKVNDSNYNAAGIGRIVELKDASLGMVIDLVKDKLNLKNLRYAGNLNSSVKKLAIVNGSGEDYFELARAKGADTILTGDTTYHFVSDYKEMGMNIIDAGHFGTEWLSFLQAIEMLKTKVKEQYSNIEFIVSSKIKDPYEII